METRTYKIPEFKLEGLRSDFARLVKRAERLGAPSPVLTVAGEPFAETTIEVNEITGAKNTIVRVFYQVTVAGETPVVGHFEFSPPVGTVSRRRYVFGRTATGAGTSRTNSSTVHT